MVSLRNRLFVGDARNRLSEFPDESVHLTITSPPYNPAKNYEDEDSDRQPIEEWRDMMPDVIDELFRVTAPDGKVRINVTASFERRSISTRST